MDTNTLESTNKRLHALERKLSLVLTASLTQTAASAQLTGSVVHDAGSSGLAASSIRLSVLQYIKSTLDGSDFAGFDANRVYADRQLHFATSFAREYSPSTRLDTVTDAGAPGDALDSDNYYAGALDTDDGTGTVTGSDAETSRGPQSDQESDYGSDNDATEPCGFAETGRESNRVQGLLLEFVTEHDDDFDAESDFDPAYDDDLDENPAYELNDDDDDDDMLLPPLPPRLPPRDMDPGKLYGLFDFLGPDPLHCTLARDEPVYLVNDSDNYWWLIKKLTKLERLSLWQSQGSTTELASDEEDGKIGFVPAECLETYGERLARLNCFKNEELERSSRETLPQLLLLLSHNSPNNSVECSDTPQQGSGDTYKLAPLPLAASSLGRSGSILKKTRGYRQSNKLVTFENLGDLDLDDDFDNASDDVIDFSDHYYALSHDDVPKITHTGERSEVLSDVFPEEFALSVKKTSRRKELGGRLVDDLLQPKMTFSGDNGSIGSFSPDTPPVHRCASRDDDNDDEERVLRRSLILERLNRVTSDMLQASRDEPAFGGTLQEHAHSLAGSDASDYDSDDGRSGGENVSPCEKGFYEELDCHGSRGLLLGEDVSTPQTSVNSLSYTTALPKATQVLLGMSVVDKKRAKPVYDMYLPILGKLDELTEKLAELEYLL